MTFRKALFAAMIATVMLGGCKRAGDIVIEQGVGITAIRSVCSAVGVPDYTNTPGGHPGAPTELARFGQLMERLSQQLQRGRF